MKIVGGICDVPLFRCKRAIKRMVNVHDILDEPGQSRPVATGWLSVWHDSVMLRILSYFTFFFPAEELLKGIMGPEGFVGQRVIDEISCSLVLKS